MDNSTLSKPPVPIIIDSDANNELDDQHALAYALLSQDTLEVLGITVNNTPRGGGIENQYEEAKRVLGLCNRWSAVPLLTGANKNFREIHPFLHQHEHDGFAAVDFLVECARKSRAQALTIIAIGKLTNVALALAKAPDISNQVRVVWLGSNYPDPGEYNFLSDPDAVNETISSCVDFSMVVVRYGKESGTAAVMTSLSQVQHRLRGAGPNTNPITGRHGGMFTCFGDYAIDLFKNAGTRPRSLHDVVAVAIVKQPKWGKCFLVPAPIWTGANWAVREDRARPIKVWQDFNRDAILNDLFKCIRHTGDESEPSTTVR